MKKVEALSFLCDNCQKQNLVLYIENAVKVLCPLCLTMHDIHTELSSPDLDGYEERIITDFYCNGFFGRRYDLAGSVIINRGIDYITIRDKDGFVDTAFFEAGWQLDDINKLIDEWTN